jgi:GT2 family glycosyltransferase
MRTTKHAPIAFAILTHNALEFTKLCIKSILENTPFGYDLHIVDNASTDGTPGWLKAQSLANLHFVLSEENLGLPRGRNFLLREIMPLLPKDGFLIFLDNDMELLPGWHQPFLELFQSHPEAGIASGDGRKFLVHKNWRELLYRPDDRMVRVDGASGGFCFWVRRQTVLDVGEFDERLGNFWHEDDDYCVRAISKGYEVFYVPACVVHHGHKSGVDQSDPKMALGGSALNQQYLVNKWREAGYVDESGYIIHPAANDLESRRLLALKLSRPKPIPPQELERAAADLGACLDAVSPLDWAREHRESLTPTLLALLELEHEKALAGSQTVPVNKAQESCRIMAQQRYRTFWRDRLRVPVRQDGHGSNFCKLCDISDWEKPAWAEVLDEIMQQGYSQDYYRRERSIWEQVQFFYGIQQLGCLRPNSSGLVIGDTLERVTWALTNHWKSVTAVGGGKSIRANKQAPFRYRPDNLEVLETAFAAAVLPEQGFDHLICLSLTSLGDHQDACAAVRRFAGLVRPGGMIAIALEVILNHGQDDRLYLPEQVEELVAVSGMDCVEPPDFGLSLETLDRLYDDRCQHPYPHLVVLSGDGRVLSTSQIIFLQSPLKWPSA